jgi:hypothetical protein
MGLIYFPNIIIEQHAAFYQQMLRVVSFLKMRRKIAHWGARVLHEAILHSGNTCARRILDPRAGASGSWMVRTPARSRLETTRKG